MDLSYTEPEFRQPPVIETVLGVQFEPLTRLNIAHIGLYWNTIRQSYRLVEQRNALEPQIETFDSRATEAKLRWKISGQPELPRAWFISDASPSGQQLIQLQQDRFVQNWRRKSSLDQEYPRYRANSEQFRSAFESFLEFCRREQLGDVVPTQCEVTYVNHIWPLEGETIATLVHRCFNGLTCAPGDEFLPSVPESVHFGFSYELPDKRGRLRVSINPALSVPESRQFLDFRLTARGAPESPTMDEAMRWMDLGHHWVVCAFKSLTTPVMHKEWKLLVQP